MKVKSIAILLATLILASVFAGCGSSTATKESETAAKAEETTQTEQTNADDTAKYDPFGKYAETVTMSIGRDTVPQPNLPEGDTLEKNQYLQVIKDRLNIDVKYEWLADSTNQDTYNQKVNLTISSGEIPDVMLVYKQSQLNDLIDGGMVEDLTPVFERTLSPFLKGYYDTYGDNKYTGAVSDGKLFAIPNLNIGYQHGFLWVRKDWMDKVGASAPKTLDDVINLAKAFIEKDPGGNGKGKTVGITADPKVAGIYNGVNQLDPLFAVYKSFPRSWVKDASGNYTYGTIAPETKAALAKVAEMYKDGLIDQEFAVRKQADTNALIASGKAGITFGPWWIPFWPLADSVKNNIDAEWLPVLAPLDADGNFNAPMQNSHTAWFVVRKGYKNPEAVVKVLNLEYQGIRNLDPTIADDTYPPNTGVNWAVWPLSIQLDYNDAVLRGNKKVKDGVAAKGTDDPSFKGTVENVLKNMEKKDAVTWADHAAWYTGASLASLPTTFADLGFPGQTLTMETKWANLQKIEDEAILKIILGEASIDSFDDFVAQWKKLGGDEITKEVNEILK